MQVFGSAIRTAGNNSRAALLRDCFVHIPLAVSRHAETVIRVVNHVVFGLERRSIFTGADCDARLHSVRT